MPDETAELASAQPRAGGSAVKTVAGRCKWGHEEISDRYALEGSDSHEYFHVDNGAGPGASHQTGWTGLVCKLLPHSGE